MSPENFTSYQRVAAQTIRFLSEKKRSGWFRFCEELSPSTPPTKIWKNLRRFRNSVSGAIISSNDSSGWIDQFSFKLAPPSVPSLEELFPPLSHCYSSDKFESPFSWEELSTVLEGLKDSSPGIDGIPYSFIYNSSTPTKLVFLSILNNIFLASTPPEEWRTQLIIPILKHGKPNSDPSSYRPIALSCTMAKILEHLIKNRLEWFVESKKLLAKSQFGFRKGFGTIDSLSIILTDIRIALSKNECVVGVFLDISSAYDNVLLPILRQKMLQLSIPARLLNIILSLLSSRSVSIRSPNYNSSPRQVWKGLPQGSVLSPLLFSMYTFDLELSVNPFCEVLQYADDLALYVSAKKIDEASSRLNSAVSYLQDWLHNHGLSLSIPKSKVVVFSRFRSIPDISISYRQQKFMVKDKVNFLGFTLDSRLTGIQHINNIMKKCENNINILRSLSGVWWGSHPYTQKILYNAIIRSHFDYGSFLLVPCIKSALSILDKIQAKCLRIICGAMKSSPINALQVECGEAPLHLRRQYLSDRFFLKVIQFSNHPLIPKLNSLSDLIPSNKYWSYKNYSCLLTSLVKFLRLPCPVLQNQMFPLFAIPFDVLNFHPQILSLALIKFLLLQTFNFKIT
ncbi:putative pol protein [Danaus plexippus plexippus]|uniref:Pol protein n=1 Tax=Danaus plexippus plexippus TaxID=278856 RepID=A0A212F1B8_DANPL|nr:putative pol protein [Danaus plexippus plexippus]